MQKILIVDDEENIRKVIREYLEFEGFYVLKLAMGKKQLKCVKKIPMI